MIAKTLEVNVETKLTVPIDQAERCMRLLEMFLDDNPDITILCETKEIMYAEEVKTRHFMSLKKMDGERRKTNVNSL